MFKARIILLSLLAAVLYGVLHDQITVRICLEYFSIAHPPLFHTASPTMLALCWGVAATAGIGAILGVLLALVSEAGSRPVFPFGQLVPAIARLLGVMAASATLAGLGGYFLSAHSVIGLPEDLAEAIAPDRYNRFMAAWFAHGASYLVGLGGGAWLVFRIWRARGRPPVLSVFPRSRWSVVRAVLLAAMALLIFWMRCAS